jgi:hypothetical protein
MASAGDSVPFFELTDVAGASVKYRDLWQRKNLLLVMVPDQSPQFATILASLQARMPELTSHDSVVVITSDAIAGLPMPGVLVADQWGEIYYVAPIEADEPSAADPEALLAWLRFVQYQCPECQGEAR